jgi:hypothetical protein
VDDFARFFAAQRAIGLRDPVGQTVAAEACRAHQVDILNVGAMLQMRNQAAEGGCGNRICEYGVGHGDPFADLHHPVVQHG